MSDYDYSQDTELPAGDNILAILADLARQEREAKKAIKEAEETLKAAQSNYKHIVEVLLPDAMDNAGQKKCTTADGLVLELKEVLRASIPVGREQECFAFLREHGNGSVIKNEVKVSFGRGQEALSVKTAELLESKLGPFDIHPERKPTVHHQTLQATLREMMSQGTDVPLEMFGAIVQRTVVVK